MSDNTPLSVEAADGEVVIRIGIETLAHAFQETDFAKPYDVEANDWVARFKVTDAAAFAREVARALQREREDGWTVLHGLLDKACAMACEDGAEGVEHLPRRAGR